MHKRLFAFMLAVALGVVLTTSPVPGYAQESQSIRAEIPFEFVAIDQIYPAGSYRIGSIGDSRTVWRISGSSPRLAEFLLTATLAGNPDLDPQMTFHRYGDRYFLRGFKTASYDINLGASKAEKALRAPGRMAREMVVVNLEPRKVKYIDLPNLDSNGVQNEKRNK